MPVNYIARLNPNGSLDTGFTPPSLGGEGVTVYSIALQADGKILIGGYFKTVGGVPINYVARLNPDGSLDTTFNPNVGGTIGINSIALQSDGKILIGGGFTTIGGVARSYIARLNPNGSVDTTFNPNGTTRRTLPGIPGSGNVNGSVGSIGVQADGKILIGGSFATIGGVTRTTLPG